MPRDDENEETSTNAGADVEMVEGVEGAAQGDEGITTQNGSEVPAAEEDMAVEAASPRTTFLSYLSSPIVTLLIGDGEQTVLTAHQGLLVQSPFFEEACRAFVDDGSPRQIELPNDDVETVGCFLEYLYTGEYFPRKLQGQRVLESDPAAPSVDETGLLLLRHARIYTLADKFGVDALRTLASSKIHCINSTAKGEIVFARYVYGNTGKEDVTIRAPVAKFWATRSQVLRAEAEDEFKSLCLEFPEFAYEVLTRVLDDKLKRDRNEKMRPQSSSGSVRKRARQSSGA